MTPKLFPGIHVPGGLTSDYVEIGPHNVPFGVLFGMHAHVTGNICG
jgi:hypothetical protein